MPGNNGLLPVAMAVDHEAGTFGLAGAGLPDVGIVDACLSLSVNGKLLRSTEAEGAEWDGPESGELAPGAEAHLVLRFGKPAIEWAIRFATAADGLAIFISSSVRNAGSRPVELGQCRLLDTSAPGASVKLGDKPNEAVVLVCSGTTAPSRVRQVSSGDRKHVSKTIAQLFDPQDKGALHAAFVTFDRANTEHEVRCSESGDCLDVTSYCDFAGFELAPSAAVETEKLVLILSRDPHACLEAWADRVAEHYQPRIWPKSPAGWVGWAWVDPFNVETYEEVVLRNARALRRRLPGFDFDYIWVSIGNLRDGLPGNWLEWNGKLFPSGVRKLVEELGDLNLKLGFWMGSFWMCTSLIDQIDELQDALLSRDGEPMLVRSEWSYGAAGKLPKGKRPGMVALDPTHPKTHDLLRRVLSTYYEWGVRYYMIDFLHAVSGSTPGDFVPDGYHDRSIIPGPEAYRTGLQVVREAAGEDTYLLSSTGPTYQNVGLMDACRVGNDYGEGRALNRESYFYPATFVINQAQYWTSHLAATNAMAAGYFTHRKLYLADSGNVLTVDKPIPLSDARISATIFGLNGGPIMLGDDIDRMSDERLALVKKCLPTGTDCARPVDLFHSPEPDYPKVFHLKISREWDEWDLLAVFNYGDEQLVKRVEQEALGLDVFGEYAVWDFWNERYEGIFSGAIELTVPAHSVRLLRLARLREHPWLLSTDMHLRQGDAEIADCRWDSQAMTLSLRATRRPGEKGTAFILVPPGLSVADPKGLWIAKDARDNRLIIRCPFEFETEPAESTIAFKPIDT